jgi:predicted N-acyltransferase
MQIEIVNQLAQIDPAAFDALGKDDNPFVRHAFLNALETSHSVGHAATGWLPRHVLVRDGGDLVGAVPLYEKHDSYGEFIFDWAWAQGAAQAGLQYYPKMVSAVPFTPANGERLLLHPQLTPQRRHAVTQQLLSGMHQAADACCASSIHVLFCSADNLQALTAAGMLPRRSFQFHWDNPGHWQTFDDYLGALRAPSRKQVRKERRTAQSHGLTLSMRRASELPLADVLALYAFYRSTVDEKGAVAYLSREFFVGLHQSSGANDMLAAMAHRGSEPVAGAVFFARGTSLFGRYWGYLREAPHAADPSALALGYDALHFELCYYLPIQWCLQHGVRHFEAGAQGEHKLRRGLLPQPCHSAHWLRHAGLRAAVKHYVQHETAAMDRDMQLYAAHTPYQRG